MAVAVNLSLLQIISNHTYLKVKHLDFGFGIEKVHTDGSSTRFLPLSLSLKQS